MDSLGLDAIRSKVLSRTLRFRLFRYFYRDRERRTLALFTVALIANFGLVFLSPHWLFYVTPLLLGVPHLFASLIFSKRFVSERVRAVPFFAIGFAVFVSYLLQIEGVFQDSSFLSVALAVLMSLFLFRSVLHSASKRALVIVSLPAILIAVYSHSPVVTTILLMLAHNFIAFYFWYRSAQTLRAKRSVGLALLFTGVSLFALYLVGDAVAFRTRFAYESIGELLFIQGESKFAYFGAQAFLLTQGLHYFIWLKAIPDYQATAKTPGGFALTLKMVRSQAGKPAAGIAIVVMLMLAATVSFLGWEASRRLYISVAAYHGFLEIAVLWLLLWRVKAPRLLEI